MAEGADHMIRFACPSCEKVYKVPDGMGGKVASCTNCRTQFLIPNPTVLELSPPPPPEPEILEAEVVEEVIPPPPTPSKLIIPVVLEPCPQCRTVLTVTTDDLGHPVECPRCRTIYTCVEQRKVTVPPPPPPVFVPVPVYVPPSSTFLPMSQQPVNFALTPPKPPPPPVVIEAAVVLPSPPPPEPVGVAIAPCPQCRAELTVAADDVGRDVECPFCKRVYKAVPPVPKAGTQLARVIRRGPVSPPPPPPGAKKPYRFKSADDDDEDDDEYRQRRRR